MPYCIGVQISPRALGMREEADKIDRIALKNIGIRNIEAFVIDAKIRALAHLPPPSPAHRLKKPAETWRRLKLLHFQRAAKNCGEIADLFSHQKIMFHEAFNCTHAATF